MAASLERSADYYSLQRPHPHSILLGFSYWIQQLALVVSVTPFHDIDENPTFVNA